MTFEFETTILPDWIDHNGHMRDSYFGLVFGSAVDCLQDEVGFDEAYPTSSGCTIYLDEDHKHYLREVKVGAIVRIEAYILGCDEKRFHLYLQMFDDDQLAAVCEFMEVHVKQDPHPHAVPMPPHIQSILIKSTLSGQDAQKLPHRSRQMSGV